MISLFSQLFCSLFFYVCIVYVMFQLRFDWEKNWYWQKRTYSCNWGNRLSPFSSRWPCTDLHNWYYNIDHVKADFGGDPDRVTIMVNRIFHCNSLEYLTTHIWPSPCSLLKIKTASAKVEKKYNSLRKTLITVTLIAKAMHCNFRSHLRYNQ